MKWWSKRKQRRPLFSEKIVFDPPLVIPGMSSVDIEFRFKLAPDGKSLVMDGPPQVGEPQPLDKAKGE